MVGRRPSASNPPSWKVEDGRIHLLRPGGSPSEEIEQVTGMPVLRPDRVRHRRVQAPGMLASHYAPDAAMRLGATEVRPGEALLAFGPWRAANVGQAIAYRNLSENGDLREAAANLFSFPQGSGQKRRKKPSRWSGAAQGSAKRSTTGSHRAAAPR